MKKLILFALTSLTWVNWVQARSIQVRSFKEITSVTDAYTKDCKTLKPSLACVTLRAQLYLAVADQLNILERERNIKNIPVALKALKLKDRAIQLSALILLGSWAREAGVDQAVYPFINSGIPVLEYYASRILLDSDNLIYKRVAQQYSDSHDGGQGWSDRFNLYHPFTTPDYQAQKLSAYPKSEHFSPADYWTKDLQGAGFVSTDPLKKILAFYNKNTQVVAMNEATRTETWNNLYAESEQIIYNSELMKRLQEIQKEYQETQNPELLVEMDAIVKKVESMSQKLLTPGLFSVNPPYSDDYSTQESARWYFMRPIEKRPTNLVLVYFDQILGKSIIQLVWRTPESAYY